jgi:hypothetical protein
MTNTNGSFADPLRVALYLGVSTDECPNPHRGTVPYDNKRLLRAENAEQIAWAFVEDLIKTLSFCFVISASAPTTGK